MWIMPGQTLSARRGILQRGEYVAGRKTHDTYFAAVHHVNGEIEAAQQRHADKQSRVACGNGDNTLKAVPLSDSIVGDIIILTAICPSDGGFSTRYRTEYRDMVWVQG